MPFHSTIFVVTHGEIFSQLGHTGPLTVNKMALPSRYRRIWRHIHALVGRNTIALGVQRFAAGANIICLTYATDWWAVIGPVIHGESKSQATRDGAARTMCRCGSTSLASCQHVGRFCVRVCSLVCDLNRTPNCYGKTWRLLCPFFRNLHLRENLARDCFTFTASIVTNSAQNSFTRLRYCDK